MCQVPCQVVDLLLFTTSDACDFFSPILQLGLKEVKELAQDHPAMTRWHQEQTLGSCTELLATLWSHALSLCMCKMCV